MTFYSKHHSLPIPKGSNRTRRKALLMVCMLLCIQPAATAQETADSVEADGKMPGVIKQVLDRLNRPHATSTTAMCESRRPGSSSP